MSPPVGPTGLTQSCDGDHPSNTSRLGVTLGAFDTTIMFGDRRARLRQQAVAVSVDKRLTPKFTLQLAVGGIITGRLAFEGRHHALSGITASVAGAYRFVDEKGARPFVIGTASLGQSFLDARDRDVSVPLSATDARVGLVVGKSFGNFFAPFAVVRAFGGPVRWSRSDETLVGSDRYHYNVGLGALFLAGAGVDAGIEVSFLGEKRFTTGIGFSF
jgi:hypothetical protein